MDGTLRTGVLKEAEKKTVVHREMGWCIYKRVVDQDFSLAVPGQIGSFWKWS